MKKIVSVLLSLLICLCSVGCMSEEERFLQELEQWGEQNLSYNNFRVFTASQSHFNANGSQLRDWNDFDFVILSSDDVVRSSLEMSFFSEEEFVFRTMSADEPVIQKDEWLYACVAYEWGKSIDSVACTLHYTTTGGEEVSKNYVLDFTQIPFRDFRNK